MDMNDTEDIFSNVWESIWAMENPMIEQAENLIYIGESNNYILSQNNITFPLKVQLTLYRVMVPFIGFFVMGLNLAVVISSGLLIRRGHQPKCTYLLLGNVALADFLIGIGLTAGQAYPHSLRTHLSCSIGMGLIVGSSLTSIYSVGLIALDRYIYIVYGWKYNRLMYLERVRWLIAGAWFIGLFIGFLPTMGWSKSTENGRVCWFIVLASNEAIILTSIVGCVPLLAVCILYSIILYHALKKVIQLKNMEKQQPNTQHNDSKLRAFRGGQSLNKSKEESQNVKMSENQQTDVNTENESRKHIFFITFKRTSKATNQQVIPNIQNDKSVTKWKAIKIVAFTSGSFIITWCPFFLTCTYYVFCDHKTELEKCQKLRFAIASPLAILGFVNCLLNPIIYAWWHDGFRKSIKKILKKKFSRNQNESRT